MDFRSAYEKEFSDRFEREGYIVFDGAREHLHRLRSVVKRGAEDFLAGLDSYSDTTEDFSLEACHKYIQSKDNNSLKIEVMRKLTESSEACKSYYLSAKEGIDILCGSELAMQKRISLSVQLPGNEDDILPLHADTWNGVSPYDLNIWIPLTDCRGTMCLYILPRDRMKTIQDRYPGLLNSDSEKIYSRLESYLDWIEIDYGQILAFDQSLPHGYCLNKETDTQWSMNCRFKNLLAPYSDKLLGEYYTPITTRSMTRIGMGYQDPVMWL